MAPKKHGKSKQQQKKQELDRPKVTDAELAAAKQVLEDKDAKRRANSNMMYWLKSQNMRESYDEASPEVRKQFALEWFAKSLADGTVDKSSKHKAGTQKTAKESAKWWSKHKIIEVFGTERVKPGLLAMSGTQRGTDQIVTLVWIPSGTVSTAFRRTRRRTYITVALNMSSKRRRIRGAVDKHRLF